MTVGILVRQVIFTIAYYNVPALFGVNVVLSAYRGGMFLTSYRSTAAGARVIIATVGDSLWFIFESVFYGVYNSHRPGISTLAALMLFAPFLAARVIPETSGLTLEDIAHER